MAATRKVVSPHKRNTQGLIESSAVRSRTAFKRADDTISRRAREGLPINFQIISREGNVSSAYLYGNSTLRSRIIHLREQSIGLKKSDTFIPKTERASDASSTRLISTLRDEVKKLKAENKELKRQLEIAYGQLYVEKTGSK